MSAPALALEFVSDTTAHAFRRARRHVLATASWGRRQPRKRLAWFLGLAAVAVLAALVVLRILVDFVVWLWDLAFVADPPAPTAPSEPPQWAVELGNSPFWPALVDNVTTYLHQQASTTGLPFGVLPVGWAALGGVLLVMTWAPLRHRTPSLLAWWAWLAASCWQLYALTPGDSPLPALLAAGIGVVVSLSFTAASLVSLSGLVAFVLATQ